MEKKPIISPLHRAWTDTLNFFGWNRRTSALAVLGILGFLFDYFARGWDRMMDEVGTLIIHTVAPIVGFGVLLFLWNLWMAPYRMLSEKIETSSQRSAAPIALDFERPTYSLFDGRKRFTLLEAAFLWADNTPNSEAGTLPLYPEADAAYRLLSEAISDGELKLFTVNSHGQIGEPTRDPRPSWAIKRDDLVAFAKSINAKPNFLFPDSRSWMR